MSDFTMTVWHCTCTACPAATARRYEGTRAPTACGMCEAPIATLSVQDVKLTVED